MTDREVMQQALWAIEESGHKADLMAAADALRAALAEPVQEPEPVADIGLEWQPCVKLPITVHVRKQRAGETHVSTREGITPVAPDDLIMRGVAGEEYPIGRELFERTYRVGDAPPARRPLTDEEIDALWRKTVDGFKSATTSMLVRGFARAIERKITGGKDE